MTIPITASMLYDYVTGLGFNSLLDDAIEDGMEDDVEGIW